jgi:hypothetical protein
MQATMKPSKSSLSRREALLPSEKLSQEEKSTKLSNYRKQTIFQRYNAAPVMTVSTRFKEKLLRRRSDRQEAREQYPVVPTDAYDIAKRIVDKNEMITNALSVPINAALRAESFNYDNLSASPSKELFQKNAKKAQDRLLTRRTTRLQQEPHKPKMPI